MVYGLIFAGGIGRRMKSTAIPKQFLPIHGKPVIFHVLEKFQHHDEIAGIVIVCVKPWIERLWEMVRSYEITKVRHIVPGGRTGHDSIRLGLECMETFADGKDIVLIHDGVRPLITPELITTNIQTVREYGSAITCEKVRESVVESRDGISIVHVPPRDNMYIAKAPQSFYFGAISKLYRDALTDGRKSIDSAHLCHMYHIPMHMIESPRHNMKITDAMDYFVCRTIYDAMDTEDGKAWRMDGGR